MFLFFFKTFDGWLFIETFQIMSGVKNLKGAKKEDLRALQAIWNAPVSEPEFEDKRMLIGENRKNPSDFLF